MLVGSKYLVSTTRGAAFPVTDRFAVVGRYRNVGIGMRAAVQINDPQTVGETEHHIDDRRHLHHADRPDPGHDHRHASRIALPDAIAVRPARLARLRRLLHRRLPRRENSDRRTVHEVTEGAPQVDEPGAGEIETGLGPVLGEVLRREGPVITVVLVDSSSMRSCVRPGRGACCAVARTATNASPAPNAICRRVRFVISVLTGR